MQETLIEADQISYTYPSSLVGKGQHMEAVRDISFTIKRGEILGFLGPNGAGKSTTMRLLSGNLVPNTGCITICGHDLFEQPLQAKNKIGYLPDNPPLYKEFSVDEYLTFCAQIHNMTRNHITERLLYVKQRCGLEKQGGRIISHLSKGYQQRVGIAQAIIHEPEIIILDEPTVGLDPNQIFEIRELIKELGQTHSVLISSHILSEIQEICHSVQIINQGQLILKDSIAGLSERMDGVSLLVSFKNNPEVNLIAALDGVVSINPDNDQQWLIECNGPVQAISAEIVKLATRENWELYEIYKHNHSLESVFMNLTTAEENRSNNEKEQASGN